MKQQTFISHRFGGLEVQDQRDNRFGYRWPPFCCVITRCVLRVIGAGDRGPSLSEVRLGREDFTFLLVYTMGSEQVKSNTRIDKRLEYKIYS